MEDTFPLDISSTYGESEQLYLRLINAFDYIFNSVIKVTEKLKDLVKMASDSLTLLKSSKPDNKNATKNDLWGVEVPTVNGLTEVAGLGSIKKELYALVVLRRLHPQLFRNKMSCNSVLLYGPPGTGKTRLVHGLVAESGAAFYNISAGNLLGPYVGQTEQNIKSMFHHLRISKDEFKILFMDELDGLCRKRTCNENDHTRRVKTELMCELSKTDLQANVIIIGATNCPWDLDPAILRRFQKKIYVPLPNAKERVELFQLLAENIEINSQDQLKRLIDISEGYSGSDISALVQNALIIPLTELQDTTLWKKTADGFFEPDLYYFGEQMSMPSSTETLFSHLCNLPPCSIRARPINVEDLITAAKHIQVTVNTTELEKYYDFMNQK